MLTLCAMRVLFMQRTCQRQRRRRSSSQRTGRLSEQICSATSAVSLCIARSRSIRMRRVVKALPMPANPQRRGEREGQWWG